MPVQSPPVLAASWIWFGAHGMTASSATLPMIPMRFGVLGFITPLIVITANDALFQAANNTVFMATSGPEQRGVLSGLLNLSRYLGLTLAHE